MKYFLKYALEVFIITLLIAFGIQYISDYGLRNLKNTTSNDWQNILNGKINADVVINGSSRAYVGYNSEQIGKALKLNCFNIAFNAGGYNLQNSKFNIYLKKNKSPKLIIQNIDLAHFQNNTELPDEWQFIPFVNNKTINSFITKYDSKFSYLQYIPLLKYNQNFQLLKKGIVANFSSSLEKNEKTIDGFSPQKRTFKVDYLNLKKIKGFKGKKVDEKKIRKLVNEMVSFYFERLDENARVFFVWAPENKLRYEGFLPLEINIIVNELQNIKMKKKNFEFIDMRNSDISNHNEYYYDTFHLNETGATLFSKELATKINKIFK